MLKGTLNDDDRTVRLSFASQEPYERWFGPEILTCTPESINLSRFDEGLGCLLYNHNRDAVIGHVESTEIVDGRAYAVVRFDTDEASDAVYQKVKSGTLQGVSVGYKVDSWEEVESNKRSLTLPDVVGPASIAMRWEPLEISIVSVPADASVGVGRSEDEPTEIITTQEEERNMPNISSKTTQATEGRASHTPVVPEANPAPAIDADAVRDEAQRVERQRAEAITNLCRQFDVDPADHISQGRSVSDVQASILESLAEQNRGVATIRQGEQDEQKRSAAMSDAILLRGGLHVTSAAEGSQQFRSMRLRDMMIDQLEREGKANARYMDDQDLIRAALTGTGAFPNVLAATVNKAAATAYVAAPTTFETFTSEGSMSDFKATKSVRISEAGELIEIPENGEFKHDELTDAGVEKTLATFGRSFSLTRQAIINDDLGMLTKIPQSYAAAARRGLNRLVYQMLSNDKNYSTAKGNKAETGAALSVATLSEGRKAMRTQKNIRNKEILNIAPKFLIVPAALETQAYQLLHSLSDPSQTNSAVVNPFSNSLQIVCDAELDAISETAWYLAATPGLGVDTIEVSYLNGNKSPMIESQASWERLGMDFRIYIDYGVTVLDYKGLFQNVGA